MESLLQALCQHLCVLQTLLNQGINGLVKYLKNLKFSSYFSVLFLIDKNHAHWSLQTGTQSCAPTCFGLWTSLCYSGEFYWA